MMIIEDIKEYLPHRYPFLLVDRVTEVIPGESIQGYKNVTVNEPFFIGHFPDHLVMPGVLIIEAMAQIAGILGYKTVSEKPSDEQFYYLVGADKVRFKKPVIPGDQLILQADINVMKKSIWKFNCTAKVDNELVCQANITCAKRPFNDD